MKYITISYDCDRCKKHIQYSIPNVWHVVGYNVSPNGTWKKYRRANEELICLGCMMEDPEVPKFALTGSL